MPARTGHLGAVAAVPCKLFQSLGRSSVLMPDVSPQLTDTLCAAALSKIKGQANGEELRSPVAPATNMLHFHTYNCRHHNDAISGGCMGVLEMSAEDRRLHRSVVCSQCEKFCGCGRRGCGSEAHGKLCRVVSGRVEEDEAWCKSERRWAAMEEEEDWDSQF